MAKISRFVYKSEFNFDVNRFIGMIQFNESKKSYQNLMMNNKFTNNSNKRRKATIFMIIISIVLRYFEKNEWRAKILILSTTVKALDIVSWFIIVSILCNGVKFDVFYVLYIIEKSAKNVTFVENFYCKALK